MRGEEERATVATRKHLHNRHRKPKPDGKSRLLDGTGARDGRRVMFRWGRRPVSELRRTTHSSICALTQLTAAATTKPDHAELLVRRHAVETEKRRPLSKGEKESRHTAAAAAKGEDGTKRPPHQRGSVGRGTRLPPPTRPPWPRRRTCGSAV